MTGRGRDALPAAAFALAFSMFLAAVGCAVRPNPRRFFTLAPEAPERSEASARPRLHVAELECAAAYDQFPLVFRVSPVELRSFRYAMWTAKPGTMVAETLRRYLATSDRFVIVEAEDAADLVLGGRVDAIEQVVEDRGWLGRLELQLTLRRARDGRVVWQRRIDGVLRSDRRDVAEVVAAQSRILTAGLAEALPSLTEAALSAAVGTPAGTPAQPH